MNTIKSFLVDHTKLKEGIYISRIDGDCVTYDLRFCRPNTGILLDNAALRLFSETLKFPVVWCTLDRWAARPAFIL